MTEQGDRRPPPTEADVRRALLGFSELIRRLEERELLLRNLPLVLGRLGDLRRLIFEYEVRVTERLLPIEDPTERESRRIVRDAKEQSSESVDEWAKEWRPPDDQSTSGG
jgi:hypothetical protein